MTHIHEVSVPTPKSKSGRVTGTWLRNFQIADCSDSEDSDYSNMTKKKMKKEMLQVLKIIKIDLGEKLINQIDMDGSSYCISIIVSYSFTLMI